MGPTDMTATWACPEVILKKTGFWANGPRTIPLPLTWFTHTCHSPVPPIWRVRLMTWIVTTPLKTGLGLLSDWHWVPGSCRVCQKALGYPNPPEKRGSTALLPLDSALHTRCGAWTTAIIGLHALAEDSAGVREDVSPKNSIFSFF